MAVPHRDRPRSPHGKARTISTIQKAFTSIAVPSPRPSSTSANSRVVSSACCCCSFFGADVLAPHRHAGAMCESDWVLVVTETLYERAGTAFMAPPRACWQQQSRMACREDARVNVLNGALWLDGEHENYIIPNQVSPPGFVTPFHSMRDQSARTRLFCVREDCSGVFLVFFGSLQCILLLTKRIDSTKVSKAKNAQK